MTDQDLTLSLKRTYQAPIDAVFGAWTSAEVLGRWFHAGHGWSTPEATVDLSVGGELRVVMENPRNGNRYGGGGRFTEIDRPRRLAFTWLWDHERVRTLIEVDLEEAGGATTVHFTHSGLWDEAAVSSHRSGWTTCLDNLGRTLGESGPEAVHNCCVPATVAAPADA
jgi:uncharacterized protein YndB with AHSA1/START domain